MSQTCARLMAAALALSVPFAVALAQPFQPQTTPTPDFTRTVIQTTDLGHRTYLLRQDGGNVIVAVGEGGIIIVGTGSIGSAVVGGCEVRVGGYGFPISDEGSGADLGLHAIRLALRFASE